MTPEDVAAFEECIAAGGVALFPADTVYGLATDPDSPEGVERIYQLKGRPPDRPVAIMFFGPDQVLEALPELGPRTRAAVRRLLPGAVTLLVPNPERRWPRACGPSPETLGLRIPALYGELQPLAVVRRPMLQTSANMSGGPNARRVPDVDPAIRAGVDLVLDGGVLPGTSSTVVDLTGYEDGHGFTIVREGAVSATGIEGALA